MLIGGLGQRYTKGNKSVVSRFFTLGRSMVEGSVIEQGGEGVAEGYAIEKKHLKRKGIQKKRGFQEILQG